VWLLLLLLAQDTADTIAGTYWLDKAALREITVEQLETELGSALDEAQLAAVDAELEKLEVALTLEASGKVTYSVETGIEQQSFSGRGRWELDGAKLTLWITHQLGLRLERKQVITGTYANYTIFTRLGDDLPMVTLVKQPPAPPDP